MFSRFFKSKAAAPSPVPTPEPVAATVPSPCNSVCDMDWANNICKGCYRTPNEIGGWDRMDDAARLAVLAAVETRRPAS